MLISKNHLFFQQCRPYCYLKNVLFYNVHLFDTFGFDLKLMKLINNSTPKKFLPFMPYNKLVTSLVRSLPQYFYKVVRGLASFKYASL